MVVFEKKNDIIERIASFKKAGASIGFVPTMGALHDGHLSLLKRAKAENSITVVSIFVNPTQFNNPEDLKNYPRTLESDSGKLEKAEADLLFYPDVKEMYPDDLKGEDQFEFGPLETVMEGAFRPGHFKGVAQIVSRLFKIITPRNAYFGEKDFQQLTIIHELVRRTGIQVNVIGCPTIREQDGLAMSSRNLLLNDKERSEAPAIFRALSYVISHQSEYPLTVLKEKAIEIIEHSKMMNVEYFEIADENSLQPLTDLKDAANARCFTAVKLGKVRLIDNMPFTAIRKKD